MNMKFKHTIALFLLMGAFIGQLPTVYAAPTMVSMEGTIDNYDRKTARITIDDMSFILAPTAIIKNQKGVTTTSFQLTPRTKINFKFQAGSSAPDIAGTIREIRLK